MDARRLAASDNMQTPREKLTQEEFNAEIARWIRTQAICRSCGRALTTATVCVSIHASKFGNICAGSGEVVEMAIPYCPRCEEPPQESTCIHKRLFASEPLELDDSCGSTVKG